jgi:hypothetical protein
MQTKKKSASAHSGILLWFLPSIGAKDQSIIIQGLFVGYVQANAYTEFTKVTNL